MLQNAEDNAYADGVQPELRIILRETYMDVECNELGFSDDNVKAFCGIGQSTKKNQQGYIGVLHSSSHASCSDIAQARRE